MSQQKQLVHCYETYSVCVAMLSPLQPFVFMLLALKARSLTAYVFEGFITLRFYLLVLFE